LEKFSRPIAQIIIFKEKGENHDIAKIKAI